MRKKPAESNVTHHKVLSLVQSLLHKHSHRGSGTRTLTSASMCLVQFRRRGAEGSAKVGVESTKGVVDLKALDQTVPSTMREFLELGEKGIECAQSSSAKTKEANRRHETYLGYVWCEDKNHAKLEIHSYKKEASCAHACYSQEEDARGHVAGFTVASEVSAHDWQMKNGKQWLLGKTFDTFCPLGPALVNTEALKDVHNLGIRCLVNGDVVQDSNTSQLIFKTEKVVVWVSQ
ncbi:fumarylacetoacetate hydrolase domain-containing protein 2A-like [Ictalurus furcatus]|uniref:fumarylacetoacetate hydrolase domain-containing protein 2A-like n=1 Tax=Ictalurus furcatus TaxID=66913 RepID=UPI0023501819|nr:fumarylacetoacetate hydrolase domain-containing protein 2A-like [Ictalurus furcatus]